MMKKLLILVLMTGLAGCSEEYQVEPDVVSSDAPPAAYSERSLRDEQDAQRQAAVTIVAEAVQGFRLLDSEKRYPDSLNQLVERGMLTSLPDLPVGYYFTYDPETGEVDTRGGMSDEKSQDAQDKS